MRILEIHGFFLTFLTYKLPNFEGVLECGISPNFGMSERSEKIETFISEEFLEVLCFFSLILTL